MQLQPDFTDYFNELIAAFEAENPDITVRWIDVPWGDMQSKILTAVSAGTAPDGAAQSLADGSAHPAPAGWLRGRHR